MKKDVTISVKGNQTPPYMDDITESISAGRYSKRNGIEYVRYEESAGDFDNLKCLLKIQGDSVEITKKGSLEFFIHFEKGRKCVTSFITFFGIMSVSILTNEMIILRDKDEILIKLEYDIMFGGGTFAGYSADITIKSVG